MKSPALAHLEANDSIIAALIATQPAPKLEVHTNYFEQLTSSIISQQLSVKAAHTIEQRFKQLFSGRLPSPSQLLEADPDTLRGAGLSRPKISYLIDLSQKTLDGTLDFGSLEHLTNDEIVALLTQVKGIGEWTAHMFLLFCMGREDVLPTGDLGIRNSIGRLYGFGRSATPDEVVMIAKKYNWQPHTSIASLYLWQSLDNMPLQ